MICTICNIFQIGKSTIKNKCLYISTNNLVKPQFFPNATCIDWTSFTGRTDLV